MSSANHRSQLVTEGVVEAISISTVARWLAHDALRPWRYRSWIFPRDPHFAELAGVVLDLYDRRFEGKTLRPDEFVISADEKTSIQARCRCHPTLPPAVGRTMNSAFDLVRGPVDRVGVGYVERE